MVCFTLADAQEIERALAVGAENTNLADDLADALEASELAQNALVAAGRAEYQLERLRARLQAEERQSHLIRQGGLGFLALLGALLAR